MATAPFCRAFATFAGGTVQKAEQNGKRPGTGPGLSLHGWSLYCAATVISGVMRRMVTRRLERSAASVRILR